jgi:hypothetical protein
LHSNGLSQKSILVYHQDYSFSEYIGFSKIFVAAGEKIKVGQPIGKALKTKADDIEYTRLSLAVFFLDKNKFKDDQGSRFTHISPVFHTTDGDTKLEENKNYISELSETVLTQEMSTREKKKFEKQKAEDK